MNYYISDMHFGHKNIIRHDNRPFDSVEEMEEEMVSRWNSVVTDEDIVYVLGDFSWHKEEKTLEILDKLNGKIVLIKGNHDKISPKISRKLHGRYDYLEVNDNGVKVILCHYPMPFWNGQFRDTIHLYGHVHNSNQQNYCLTMRRNLMEEQGIPMRMINVGSMMNYIDYTPRTLKYILENNKYEYVEGVKKHDQRV